MHDEVNKYRFMVDYAVTVDDFGVPNIFSSFSSFADANIFVNNIM